jgi:FeS assembly SUF system regulator
MLRLSKLTDYAVVVLVRLADSVQVQTSPGIAASTGIPEPTVAKVLKTLAAGGLVASQRGARGGYRLLRQLSAIPVADVIAAFDGPIALAACVEGSATECESQALCPMRGRWDPVNDAIHQALSSITLADMRAAGIPRAFRVPAAKASEAVTPSAVTPPSVTPSAVTPPAVTNVLPAE